MNDGIYRDSIIHKHDDDPAKTQAKPMDATISAPLFGIVLPADLRTRHTHLVGISILLLVPVCLGHPGFGINGFRLP